MKCPNGQNMFPPIAKKRTFEYIFNDRILDTNNYNVKTPHSDKGENQVNF